jgi:hypothetical protein
MAHSVVAGGAFAARGDSLFRPPPELWDGRPIMPVALGRRVLRENHFAADVQLDGEDAHRRACEGQEIQRTNSGKGRARTAAPFA